MSRYGGREAVPLDCKVYVGELGNNGSRQELEDAFGYYGPLKEVLTTTTTTSRQPLTSSTATDRSAQRSSAQTPDTHQQNQPNTHTYCHTKHFFYDYRSDISDQHFR